MTTTKTIVLWRAILGGLIVTYVATCQAGESGAAGPQLSKWKYYLPLTIPEEASSGVIKLYLPPMLLARAQPSLADLRVMSAKDSAVAYVIREQRGKTSDFAMKPPAAYINRSFVAEKSSQVMVDFGNSGLRDSLEIITNGDNFRRRATIEASANGKTWRMITNNAWLFAIPKNNSIFRVSRVHMPANDFRYCRITVFNGDGDKGKIEIQKVMAPSSVPRPADITAVPVVGIKVRENPKDRYTEIQLDLGYENIRLCDVSLDFSDQRFFRTCTVLGRNQEKRLIMQQVEDALPRKTEIKEPWSRITQGYIYRFPHRKGTSARLTIPCSGNFRFLAIRIYNHDDKPLSFVSAKVRRYQQWLLFPAKAGESLQVYFGNAQASSPRYDLPNYINTLVTKGVHSATPGQVQKNPKYRDVKKTVPWSEQHRWLLTAVILLMILIMGGLILRQAKQVGPVED